jgi:prepilin-type N-terminal cleavage/methylation domain-containing protein
MSQLVSRLRRSRLRSEDSGFTLVEMIIAMGIFSVILVIFASATTDWTRIIVRDSRVTDQTTASRVVFDALDKQVPSAALLNRPVAVGTSYYVEFRNNGVAPNLCTQWVYRQATGEVAYRTWPTDTGSAVTPSAWRVVATRMVNTSDPFSFVRSDDGVHAHQQLVVALQSRRGTGPTTYTSAAFVLRNSTTSASTNLDTNNNGVSDTQVCQDISGARP